MTVSRSRRLKYRFWRWIHDLLESLWHWSYRVGVKPNQEPWPEGRDVIYTKILENEEVTIYRSN